MIRIAVAFAVAVLASVAQADADDVKLPRTVAVLHVPPTWHKVDAPSLVAAYRTDAGLVLAVTRAQTTNWPAWTPKTRDAYLTQIERGALKNLKRTARKVSEASGVPALDLEARRDDGTTLILRILVFRTYAIAAAVDVPRGGSLADARAVTTTFAPPPDYNP